jgi:hypothetical protein
VNGAGPGPTAMQVPAGIDHLIRLAATDAGFRRRLLADRAKAARAAGVRLMDSERAVLDSIPTEQLATIIDKTSVPRAPRRTFLQAATAWVVGLFGGVAVTAAVAGCNPLATKGIRRDQPPPQPAGERPDVPPPKQDEAKPGGTQPPPGVGQPAGIRPDVPVSGERPGSAGSAGAASEPKGK